MRRLPTDPRSPQRALSRRAWRPVGRRVRWGPWLCALAIVYFGLQIYVESRLSTTSRSVEELRVSRDSLRVEISLLTADVLADLTLASILSAAQPKGLTTARPGQVAMVSAPPPERGSLTWADLLPPLLLELAAPEARATDASPRELSHGTAASAPPGVQGERPWGRGD